MGFMLIKWLYRTKLPSQYTYFPALPARPFKGGIRARLRAKTDLPGEPIAARLPGHALPGGKRGSARSARGLALH